MLSRYEDIKRIAGPHCYEMYGGEEFEILTAEEPGTYFLTDFMVRTFRGLILKSMGLPLDIRQTGYGLLESRLAEIMGSA